MSSILETCPSRFEAMVMRGAVVVVLRGTGLLIVALDRFNLMLPYSHLVDTIIWCANKSQNKDKDTRQRESDREQYHGVTSRMVRPSTSTSLVYFTLRGSLASCGMVA